MVELTVLVTVTCLRKDTGIFTCVPSERRDQQYLLFDLFVVFLTVSTYQVSVK